VRLETSLETVFGLGYLIDLRVVLETCDLHCFKSCSFLSKQYGLKQHISFANRPHYGRVTSNGHYTDSFLPIL